MGNSPTTGQEFYSGDWTEIKNIVMILQIGEGRASKVNMQLVEEFQEKVDREIDSMLEALYWTPLRPIKRAQPDGSTKTYFDGNIRRLAQYWSAGLLVLSTFQQLAQQTTDVAERYVEDSKKELNRMIQFNVRLRVPAQQMKSNISHTLPPGFQPPFKPEPDF